MNHKAMITGAAVAGLLSGSFAAQAALSGNANAGGNAGTPIHTFDGQKKGTHSCKGQNACKGQGGCKSGDNGCKGKNSCKGKGGCASAHR